MKSKTKQMYRYQVTLDKATVEKARKAGLGNLSHGLRILVERSK